MKKSINILSFIFVFIAFCLGGICCVNNFYNQKPVEETVASIKDDNIKYNSIHKDIVISSNKVVSVTEKINLTYLQNHINVGWVYALSRTNKITRFYNDKEYVTTTIAYLDNVNLTISKDGQAAKQEYFYTEVDGDYYLINAGEDYDYKFGDYEYVLSYDYDLGYDFIADFDDFTFDLMFYDYIAPIPEFSATITLPQQFFLQEGQLTFRTNEMAPLTNEQVNLSTTDTTISVSYNDFAPRHGLTMQLILPEGYFNAKYILSPIYIVAFVSLILAFIAVPSLIVFYRKKHKVVVTTEFYPPKGLSPMDVARVYRRKIKPQDFASLVIYWASKGLIKISQGNSVYELILTKQRDYDIDENTLGYKKLGGEKEYFDALFANGDTYIASGADSSNAKLISAINNLNKVEKPDNKLHVVFKALIYTFAILPLVLFTVWSAILQNMGFGVFLVLFPVIAVLVAQIKMPLLFKAVWCGMFGGIPLFIVCFVWSLPIYDIFGLRFLVVLALALAFLAMLVVPYTKNQLSVLGQVLGFKRFLQKVELQVLEKLIDEDPEYYYNILPFCYIFGLTKKLQAKFAALQTPVPSYCGQCTPVEFESILYSSMLASSVSRAYNNMHGRGGGSYHGGGGGSFGSFGGGGGGGGMRGR